MFASSYQHPVEMAQCAPILSHRSRFAKIERAFRTDLYFHLYLLTFTYGSGGGYREGDRAKGSDALPENELDGAET